MRRIWVSLLLAFCLVSSQQGALLHELGHCAPHADASHRIEADSHGPGMGCDICFAFEHIAGAVATARVVLALASTADHWRLTERFALRASDVPLARARAPPTAL